MRPGRLLVQSLWVRFSRDRGAIPSNPRKNKRREEFPRRVAGLIAAERAKSRQTGPKTGQNEGFGGKKPMAGCRPGEVGKADSALGSDPPILMKPTGSRAVVPRISHRARAKWLKM
jgi:hypothetical protein